jgi:hypothetical protein
MAEMCSMEQMQACGLKTIKLQLKFKKLAAPPPATPDFDSSNIVKPREGKLMQKEIQALTPD